MNREDLIQELRRRGVVRSSVSVLSGVLDCALNLHREDGKFKVFYQEKGLRTPMKEFDKFSDAADYFLEEVEMDRKFHYHEY